MKRQEIQNNDTKKADQETLLLEQMKSLTVLIEQLRSKPSNIDGNGKKKSGIEGELKFTNKEIKDMPRLKDFKIRIMKGKYYEIRFRRYRVRHELF